MFDTQYTLTSPTGAMLNVYQSTAKGTPRGIVHINHGLAEHAARYGKFARDLSKVGFHVYAHDHRGHGHTNAADAPQGSFSLRGTGIEQVLTDCAAVQDHAAKNHPKLPLHMFGHSMGGHITMSFVLRNIRKVKGFSVWNSSFNAGPLSHLGKLLLKFERFRLGSDVPSRILPKLTFETWAKKIADRRTDFDWLSHIVAEVDAYVSDPLCGWDASVGMWLDIMQMSSEGTKYGRTIKPADLPFADFAGGDEDPATENGSAVSKLTQGLDRSAPSAFSSTIFEGARHETLNDNVYEDALKHFLSILDRTCGLPNSK